MQEMMQLLKESVDEWYCKFVVDHLGDQDDASKLNPSTAKSLKLTIEPSSESSGSTVSARTRKSWRPFAIPWVDITGGPRSGSPAQPLIGSQNPLPASRYPEPAPAAGPGGIRPTTTVSISQ